MADSPSVDENRINATTSLNKRTAPSPSSTSISSVPKKQRGALMTTTGGNSCGGGSTSTGGAGGGGGKVGASPSSSAAAEKSNRGLRHFSMMVCKKVEEKGTTTYNEVADELVKKVVSDRQKEDPGGKFDEKNIRRRVYDALNVLMAMDIISKEKKDISWKGLPTAGGKDMDTLQKELDYRTYQLEQKKEALKEALVQQVCFRNLVLRNQRRGTPEEKIPLPFIVVNTNSEAVIHCNMSRDRTDVMFDFSMPFEINDDNTILKKMGMDRTSLSTLRQMLPDDLLRYCQSNRLVEGLISRRDPLVGDGIPHGGGGGRSTPEHPGTNVAAASGGHPHDTYIRHPADAGPAHHRDYY